MQNLIQSVEHKIRMEPFDLQESHEVLRSILNNCYNYDEGIEHYLRNVKFPPIEDFHRDLQWFNVSRPLSLKNDLKGKIVVLDFFTYCCINCMHILPDLKEIENEFSIEDGLVVIGVHSAKFVNERNSKNILSAIQRYDISHPVVNDFTSSIWNACGVSCWPTLLLLGPNGNPLVMMMGEGHKDNLRLYIRKSLEFYKSEISRRPLPIESSSGLSSVCRGPLRFPGKLAYHKNGYEEIVAVSDTGNHRVLIFNYLNGTILRRYGGPSPGFADGGPDDARFDSPQGLAFLNSDTLFVADTKNHSVRRISLDRNIVETVAGFGRQGNDKIGGRVGTAQTLSSPWDLCVYRIDDGGKPRHVLLIAMAGAHQIWALFLDATTWWKGASYGAYACVAVVGSGNEENRNNSYPNKAAFAQPSGLALNDAVNEVYVADSESSSIRRLSLVDGKVSAVVGGDRDPFNLFAFGNADGSLYSAKLQHPLGVSFSPEQNALYVADTYNHELKRVDVKTNSIKTLRVDCDDFNLNEPSGLCALGADTILVADTNNHAIKKVYVRDDSIFAFQEIELSWDSCDVAKTISNESYTDKRNVTNRNDKNKIAKSKYEIVANGRVAKLSTDAAELTIKVNISFDGLKLTESAPKRWIVDLPDDSWACAPAGGDDLNVDVVVSAPGGSDRRDFVDVAFDLVTCTETACYPKNFIVRQEVVRETDAARCRDIVVDVTISPEKIKI